MTPTAVDRWPELPYEPWKDSAATLHMWTQVVGKMRLVQMPWIDHSWLTTLDVTPRGLTTPTSARASSASRARPTSCGAVSIWR